MVTDELKRNIDAVIERVAHAAAKAERTVTVVAATKTVPIDVINTAIACGIKDIGENRVQEYVAKRDGVHGAEWHFIGTLQRNKAKYLVGSVSLIQSVNSRELAAEIDRLAAKRNIVQDVLIEVNAAGEPAKTGAAIGEAEELIDFSRSLKNVRVCGLMSVPPKDAPNEVYKTLYRMFETHFNPNKDILSVGMSGDYEKAIEFGSNMVRLGTAIFGKRN